MNPFSGDPNQQNQPNEATNMQGPTGTQYVGSNYQPPASGYQQQQYQQPQYQQPQYQQPQYQQPQYPGQYPQQPYAQRPAGAPFPYDWRYLTVAVGALLSVIAFFIPSYNIFGDYPGNWSSYSSLLGFNPYVSEFYVGRQHWLDLIIVLIALGMGVLLLFGKQMFKTSTSPMIQKVVTSLNNQPKTWGLALLALGGFGIFFHFILDLGALGLWAFGAWLFLIGLISITVGGYFIYRPPAGTTTPGAVPPMTPPNPGGPIG